MKSKKSTTRRKTTKKTRSSKAKSAAVKTRSVKTKAVRAKAKPRPKTTKNAKKLKLNPLNLPPEYRKKYLPPIAGAVVAVLVFVAFNSQLLSSRVAYFLDSRRPVATLDSQTIASPIAKNAPPKVTINSINVNAPIVFEKQNDESTFLNDLQNGVVHYPNTAVPGQEGNVVIFGHSSGVWWEPGNYKFIFTLLDKVKVGDKVFIDYKGTRYIYRVYGTQVVSPDNLTILSQGNNHDLTLITCTPVGTSTNRLIIHAAQYVPKPVDTAASAKPAALPAGAQGVLPGSSSSTLRNLREIL